MLLMSQLLKQTILFRYRLTVLTKEEYFFWPYIFQQIIHSNHQKLHSQHVFTILT